MALGASITAWVPLRAAERTQPSVQKRAPSLIRSCRQDRGFQVKNTLLLQMGCWQGWPPLHCPACLSSPAGARSLRGEAHWLTSPWSLAARCLELKAGHFHEQSIAPDPHPVIVAPELEHSPGNQARVFYSRGKRSRNSKKDGKRLSLRRINSPPCQNEKRKFLDIQS